MLAEAAQVAGRGCLEGARLKPALQMEFARAALISMRLETVPRSPLESEARPSGAGCGHDAHLRGRRVEEANEIQAFPAVTCPQQGSESSGCEHLPG